MLTTSHDLEVERLYVTLSELRSLLLLVLKANLRRATLRNFSRSSSNSLTFFWYSTAARLSSSVQSSSFFSWKNTGIGISYYISTTSLSHQNRAVKHYLLVSKWVTELVKMVQCCTLTNNRQFLKTSLCRLSTAPTTNQTTRNQQKTQKHKTHIIQTNWQILLTRVGTTVLHNTAQNKSNNFPPYPPDSHCWIVVITSRWHYMLVWMVITVQLGL